MAKRSKCLLTFALKRLRLYVKGKHSAGKEFQRGAALGKKTIPIKVLLDLAYEQQNHAAIKISGRPYSFIRKGY